jgi:hypothetical protein
MQKSVEARNADSARLEWTAPRVRRLMASEAEFGVSGAPDIEGTS